jgi:hypothetical protein
MDQAKAIINLNEGTIQLEGPMEFVRHYLEMYAPAVKRLPTTTSRTTTSGVAEQVRGRLRGTQRSCTRAIRAEIKAGFFDEPKSTPAVRERLIDKGVVCSSSMLRITLKKATEEGKLVISGRGRGIVYNRKAGTSEATPAAELP